MWGPIIMQLIQVVAPIVLKMVADHAAANNGQIPTESQLLDRLNTRANEIITEGDAWLAAHPRKDV